MSDKKIQEYLEQQIQSIRDLKKTSTIFQEIFNILKNARDNEKQVFVMGNGGSASIASHVSVDFAKTARISSATFNNSNLITCFANDYGYENLNQKYIGYYGNAGDVLIAISSSGESKNMINACKKAKKLKFSRIITLTGFRKNNTLSKMGNINFWVNSKNYNLIENTHQIYLLSTIDLLTKKKF